MKKSNSFIKKMLTTFLIGLVLLIINGGLSTSINASSEDAFHARISYLSNENAKLKQKYVEVADELSKMEAMVSQINEYDDIIYCQMLGVDFDTIEFYKYNNDSVDFVMKSSDDIFSLVDDRVFYAAERLATKLTKLKETSNLFKSNKNAILYYPTISPIKTKDFISVSSPYGYRVHPIKNDVLFHEGIDISASLGTSVYSTAQGKVIDVLYSEYGYGNRVVIQHAYGFETLYAHLGEIKVKKGQWVNKNQSIGIVGSTGLSTGIHLHYEIHKNNQSRDPLGYFYVDMGTELLAMQ